MYLKIQAKEQYEEQMSKTIAELEQKKNDSMSQAHLLQEKVTELQSELTSQQEEGNTQVSILQICKESCYISVLSGDTVGTENFRIRARAYWLP